MATPDSGTLQNMPGSGGYGRPSVALMRLLGRLGYTAFGMGLQPCVHPNAELELVLVGGLK